MTEAHRMSMFANGEASWFGVKEQETAVEIYELILAKSSSGKEAPADTLRLARLQVDADLRVEAVQDRKSVV